MKAFFTLILLILLTLPQPAQSQGVTTDTFSVVLAANYYSNYWTTPENLDPNGYWRGTNYIISGFLYPANYFDLNCPDTKNCGILVDTIYDGNGNITNFLVTPEDTTVVIGDWDCRSLIIEGPSIGAVDGEETMSEIATQTFNFYAHDLSPCPEGCYVLTEGLLDNVDERRRSISAGTKAFKNIKGDLRWIYLPGEDTLPGFGRNATGFPNIIFQFEYGFPSVETSDEFSLDVSLKRQTFKISGPADSNLPVDSTTVLSDYGAIFTVQGVIYEGGTFTTNGLNGGIDAAGNAEWDSIGVWTARGSWYSKEYDIDDGLFALNKQTFEFNHPALGEVQIMTDGEGDATMNTTLTQAVIGATGKLFGHSGESTQTMVGKNASGGWNFSYSFETGGLVTNAKEVPERKQPISMKLFPNPVTYRLNVALDNVHDFGRYTLDITDATGRLMLQRILEAPAKYCQFNLDVSKLPPGWYGLVLKKEGVVLNREGFSKVE